MDNKIKNRDLADLLGVTPACISQIIGGSRRPSPDLALKIEQATDGQVTRIELLYPDHSDTQTG